MYNGLLLVYIHQPLLVIATLIRFLLLRLVKRLCLLLHMFLPAMAIVQRTIIRVINFAGMVLFSSVPRLRKSEMMRKDICLAVWMISGGKRGNVLPRAIYASRLLRVV
jgi:hypothetical protein